MSLRPMLAVIACGCTVAAAAAMGAEARSHEAGRQIVPRVVPRVLLLTLRPTLKEER